jgi:hypothetical protein
MGIVWEMLFLSTMGIPFLKAICGAESVSFILVFVLYMGIDRDIALMAIVVVHIFLLVGGVTTGRVLNSV